MSNHKNSYYLQLFSALQFCIIVGWQNVKTKENLLTFVYN